jgi:hypothetical protein
MMADKKRMPLELLAHFKEKAGEKDESSSDEAKESDKEKRKEAVKKARLRMEEKSQKKK